MKCPPIFLVALVSIHLSGSAFAQQGFLYRFTNNCRHEIRLAVHYRNMDGDWVTRGWWIFEPGETSVLREARGRIRSMNQNWYYYAECTGSRRCHWTGDDVQVRLRGRTLDMIRRTDRQGDNEWAIRCSRS